jgi:PRC-barrel domain
MRSLCVILAVLALCAPAHAQSTPPAESTAKFIKINDNALLVSRIIGSDAHNAKGEQIGVIEDVALEGGQLVGVILAVKSSPGGGEHYVAVDPASLSIEFVEGEKKWKATVNAKIDQMQAAPEFRYEGKWRR